MLTGQNKKHTIKEVDGGLDVIDVSIFLSYFIALALFFVTVFFRLDFFGKALLFFVSSMPALIIFTVIFRDQLASEKKSQKVFERKNNH